MSYIFQDWQTNQDTSFKSRITLAMFRSTKAFKELPSPLNCLFVPLRFFYQILVEWVLGIELPWDTQVGANLKLQHGNGLVVNHETVIGENCTLRSSTTIGNKKLSNGSYSATPVIGNNVDIGANVVIIGSIRIGNNAIVGAGAIVVKDVPAGATVVGNPARVIRIVDVSIVSCSESTKEPS